MNQGAKTTAATLLAALMIVATVAAIVPYMNDGEPEGIRTGYFPYFPRDLTPEDKEYGTPEEAYAEFREVYDEWVPVGLDPESTEEEVQEARDRISTGLNDFYRKLTFFKADYYRDAAGLADEYAGWLAAEVKIGYDYDAISGDSEQPGESKEYLALANRERELIIEQNTIRSECSTVEYNGEVVSVYDPSVPWDVSKPVFKEMSERCAVVMFELVDVRNRMAELKGFDSYTDMAFHRNNSNDVSLERMTAVLEENRDLLEEVAARFVTVPRDGPADPDAVLDAIAPFLNEVSTDLGNLAEYIGRNGLLYYEPDDMFAPYSYTEEIVSHHSALISLGPPYEGHAVINTALHEFGHAANLCLSGGAGIPPDVSEIHSYGLEALAVTRAEEFFWKEFGDYLFASVTLIIDSVNTTILETMLYSGAVQTTEDIERVYASGVLTPYFWCNNEHIFSMPFYMAAYVTAGITSMAILVESLDDWDSAAEKYLKVQTAGNMGYHDTVTYAGLPDIYEGDNMRRILERVIEYAEAEGILWTETS